MDLYWGHTMIVLPWYVVAIGACLAVAVLVALVVLVVALLGRGRPRQ